MNKDVVADGEIERLRQRLHWYRVAVLILAVVLIGCIMAISSAIFIESQAAREASCGNGFTVSIPLTFLVVSRLNKRLCLLEKESNLIEKHLDAQVWPLPY